MDSELLFDVLDLMKKLERDLAVLYIMAANSIHDAAVSSVMRKIGVESATHNYIVTLIEPLIRECPPKKVMDNETLMTIEKSIKEAINQVDSLIDYVRTKQKLGDSDLADAILEKLDELEAYEENAVKIYSFLLRSYLPITSTRADAKYRAVSKLIVKLLKGIADDEREHKELLESVNEVLGRTRG